MSVYLGLRFSWSRYKIHDVCTPFR